MPKWFSTKVSVRGESIKKPDPNYPGYLLEPERCYNVAYREFFIKKFRIFSYEIAREEVPLWAKIESGACGYTTWRSSFPAEYFKPAT